MSTGEINHANNTAFDSCDDLSTSLDEMISNVIRKPRRIILVRHEQSLGNVDESTYTRIPDWKVPLTDHGIQNGENVTAKRVKDIIGDSSPVYFYASPYERTMQTCRLIMKEFKGKDCENNQLIGLREEPRLVEQQFGNFQDEKVMKKAKAERYKYGSFFYRFPNGESGLDVYNRAATFINTLFRDFRNPRINYDPDYNLVIVTHGLTLRLFLMRWFQFGVREFEKTKNPCNGGIVVMNRQSSPDNIRVWYEIDSESRARLNLPDHQERI
mmetsp:Transcript_4849/g.6549  ORF Transcript_4849/g.6549 Transcript_4849/m.6549 type:complete len:270 (+) Transcript_4849:92-901(+)|eukprot:CAMPEP_0116053470 /NCGR_PEP_ID=MMETSP0322-20121206/2204_1 /TAXON_ID=163516 /ORGANISM="Leptocylindrus danicus var. apora, Strain B651" /LENGTH=269 /DNA_ID=CAMNT_0003536635 /DNA_START=40 /DNA_END=849 /DNA_ORIENTATION=+